MDSALSHPAVSPSAARPRSSSVGFENQARSQALGTDAATIDPRALGGTFDGRIAERPTELERAAEVVKPKQGSRLVALDAARVFATFGVMWTHVLEVQGHSQEITALGRFGTSFYIIAAVFLTTRGALKHPDRSFWDGVRLRARRLLVPFALWSVIYATFYYARLLPRDDIDLGQLSVWWGPLAGCARHLWFLPFAFFATAVASAVAPRMARWTTRQVVVSTVLASTVAYWFFYRVAFFALDRAWLIDWHLHRLDRWIDETPLLVAALGIAVLFNRRPGTAGLASTAGSAQDGPVSGVRGVSRSKKASRLRPVLGWLDGSRAGLLVRPAVARVSRAWGHLRTRVLVLSHDQRVVPLLRGLDKLRERVIALGRAQPVAAWLLLGFVVAQFTYMTGYQAIHEATHTAGRFMANIAGLCLLGAFLLATPRRWMERLAPLGRYTYFAFLLHVLVIDWGFWRLSGLPGHGTLLFGVLSSVALLALCVQVGALVKKVPALRWLSP